MRKGSSFLAALPKEKQLQGQPTVFTTESQRTFTRPARAEGARRGPLKQKERNKVPVSKKTKFGIRGTKKNNAPQTSKKMATKQGLNKGNPSAKKKDKVKQRNIQTATF